MLNAQESSDKFNQAQELQYQKFTHEKELEELNFILLTKKVYNNYVFLFDINDISKYIKNWFDIFNLKIKKYLLKQEKLINEVIEDIKLMENYSSDVGIDNKPNNFYNFLNKYEN